MPIEGICLTHNKSNEMQQKEHTVAVIYLILTDVH